MRLNYSLMIIAIAAYGAAEAHAAKGDAHKFKMVCGKINSIGAPADVHASSQTAGFSLEPKSVTDYDPAAKPHPWSLGILRDNNAGGLLSIASAAFVSQSNVTIWYRTSSKDRTLPDTAACIMAQFDMACSPTESPEEADKCLAPATK